MASLFRTTRVNSTAIVIVAGLRGEGTTSTCARVFSTAVIVVAYSWPSAAFSIFAIIFGTIITIVANYRCVHAFSTRFVAVTNMTGIALIANDWLVTDVAILTRIDSTRVVVVDV